MLILKYTSVSDIALADGHLQLLLLPLVFLADHHVLQGLLGKELFPLHLVVEDCGRVIEKFTFIFRIYLLYVQLFFFCSVGFKTVFANFFDHVKGWRRIFNVPKILNVRPHRVNKY